MAEHNIDDLIDTGRYDLTLEEGHGLEFKLGDDLTYRVVEGGHVQEDMTIPVLVEIQKPERLKGTKVKGKLVPSIMSFLGSSQLIGLA